MFCIAWPCCALRFTVLLPAHAIQQNQRPKFVPSASVYDNEQPAAAAANNKNAAGGSASSNALESAIKAVVERLQQNPAMASKAPFKYVLVVKNGPRYILDLKSKPIVFTTLDPGAALPKADAKIEMQADHMQQLLVGKLSPMSAFMSGKMKVTGNMQAGQKLQLVLKPASKL